MRKILISFLCWIGRILLSLRYKINIIGKENLNSQVLNKKGGVLFLPNHPAHIDPIILSMVLWPKFQMRPLVVEYIYRQAGIQILLNSNMFEAFFVSGKRDGLLYEPVYLQVFNPCLPFT